MLTPDSTHCSGTTGTIFTWVLMKEHTTAGDVEWLEAGKRRKKRRRQRRKGENG